MVSEGALGSGGGSIPMGVSPVRSSVASASRVLAIGAAFGISVVILAASVS